MNHDDGGPGEVFTSMLHAIDNLGWERFRASFAPRVAVDYTSLWGGEPETLGLDDLARSWQELAHGYDATQHLTGPIVVTYSDDRSARCRTTLRAYHHVIDDDHGAATWMVAGQYTVELSRNTDSWVIGAIVLAVAYEEGDRTVVDVARQRSAAGIGGRTGARDGQSDNMDSRRRGTPDGR